MVMVMEEIFLFLTTSTFTWKGYNVSIIIVSVINLDQN